jgi:hypothetical protein
MSLGARRRNRDARGETQPGVTDVVSNMLVGDRGIPAAKTVGKSHWLTNSRRWEGGRFWT